MSKKNHHHGENIHRMERIPERPTSKGQSKSIDLLTATQGNLPPAQLKRITHQKTKHQNEEKTG